MFDLKDKIAIVTGASSGLGADAARAYAEHGAGVALLARRKDKLETLAKELENNGAKAIAIQCDVADEDSVAAAVKEVIGCFGKVDILLNNAGIAVGGSVTSMTQEEWQRSMDINVKGIFLMCKYVIPHMRKQKYGKVVNVGSVNAFKADKNKLFTRHSYNTSKQAVLGLSLGMAASYGQDNITVNTVCPGLFETEMTQELLFKSDDFLADYSHKCPMSRPGKKGEVNGPILFFSSDASSYTTGQYVVVDGGSSLV